MCTTKISQDSLINREVPLSISRNEFVNKLKFHDDDEKAKCLIYLDLKGIAYHVVLANFIGFNSKGKIEYKKVSNLYKYDKRIRNILYKYLSALEEGIRAYICNTYSNDLGTFKKLSKHMYNSICQGSSLNKELENLRFGQLIDLLEKLNKTQLSELYGTPENLDTNLIAVRCLRNAVSHHRTLFVYKDFKPCYIDGRECYSLVDNIKNLSQLLKPYYKKFFIEDINESCYDEKESEFKTSLPSKAVLSI